ncbi:bactofilin family protein [Acetobacter indonesiensis]|uniref:bactofilin family protein n=1 Tax=Acetobacter indonesiensis TaxID=104101 RepID=UPI0020A54B98|nr:polymer-forming cytoskeletal protein [Acetobacter indonesiensis]MCP1230251.1 polymer-forming cytoskeletal protein [Acetobacter indonesiensis]
MAGVFLFRRRKPEETKPATPAPGQNASPSGAARPAGGYGTIFPSSSQAGSTPPAAGSSVSPASPSTPDTTKETSMGRAPLPPGSPLSPGASVPPIPGAAAARGLPQQQAAQPKKDVPEQRTLVVGRGISVQGTVQDAERLVVEGTVESSMITAKELVVMPGGLFRGGVEVENAEIAGTVDGSLTARGSLTLRATGRLLGKAACRRLKVEDGGQITGQLEMLSDDSPSKPSSAPVQEKSEA